MSLILEALRKSEAERRRGQAPDLFAELPPVPRPRSAKLPAWSWLAVAAVSVLALGWWMLGRAPRVPAPVHTQAMDAADAANPPRVVDPAPTTARPQPPVRAPATPHPAIPAAPPPAGVASADTPSLPAPVPPPRSRPAPAAAQAPPAASVPTPPAGPAIPVPLPADGGAQPIHSLPADQRKALPPLKLTMHLWDEAPAQRFVIIDGQRLGEGGRIGELVVDAIEPEAVLFDWNGRKLRLPLR